jgi:hypothetical protein
MFSSLQYLQGGPSLTEGTLYISGAGLGLDSTAAALLVLSWFRDIMVET